MAGIFGEFFLVSVSHETKHEKSWKNSGKIRSKIRGQNPGRKFEKFGKLSFCNFSDLSYCVCTEQLDAEGLGRKLLLDPPRPPLRQPAEGGKLLLTPLKSRLWVLWLHLTRCSPCKHFRVHCKERPPGPRKGFWVTSSSLSPKMAASIDTF